MVFALSLAVALAGAIRVDPNEGFPVTLKVLDAEGEPLQRAFVRHKQEGILHPVNRDDGHWRAERLYLPDGSYHTFRQGEVVRFTIGAPGYLGREIRYKVKGLKHVVPVVLEPLGERSSRRRGEDESATWLAMVASLEATRSEWLAPEGEGEFRFTAETLAQLADPTEASVELIADFSNHMLAQGPDHAAEAEAWARLVATKAGASLSGPDYVRMIDRSYLVRAVAANLAWQQAEMDLLHKATGRRAHDADIARRRAASVANDWLSYAVAADSPSVGFARALCVGASVDPAFCR